MSDQFINNLNQQREKLISSFLKDRKTSFLQRHAQVFDSYFIDRYANSRIGPHLNIAKNPYALVALGGYGRKEQCIHSDIDILFLFKKSVPSEAETLIKEIVYPLWDAGFEIGHATRTIKECISLAGTDVEILMSLLDSRLICGMSSLFFDMSEGLRKKVIRSHSKKIITMLMDNNRNRHRQYGDASHLLEPNLKEGQGGLRDFHNMLWIAKVKFDLKRPKDLEYNGWLSEKDYKGLIDSLRMIHQTRNFLHHLTGRKCDHLHMEYQIQLADLMGFYEETEGQLPVERFLGELHGHMENLKELHLLFLSEFGFLNPLLPRKGIISKKTTIKGLVVTPKNMLNFISTEAILESPILLIQIFMESAKLNIPISAMAKRIITELGYLVDDAFRKNTEVCNLFEDILASPPAPFNVLNEMLKTGFLEHYIPEINGIKNRIQYNAYHIYPVDKHSLKTVRTLKRFDAEIDNERFCHRLYKELADKNLLLWAALLHDIGKCHSTGDHSNRGAAIAAEILQRIGMPAGRIETVAFLIKEHLLLIKTATRRELMMKRPPLSVPVGLRILKS